MTNAMTSTLITEVTTMTTTTMTGMASASLSNVFKGLGLNTLP